MTDEALQDALDVARGELLLHRAALSRLQDTLTASRLEAAGAQEVAVQLRGYVVQSQADVERAQNRIAALDGRVAGLDAHVAGLTARAAAREAELQAELAVLRGEVARFRGSLSWRVTRPVRVVARFLWRCRRMFGAGVAGPQAAPTPVPPAPSPSPPPSPPGDPNEPYLFKPAPLPVLGAGVVTVEELYSLSRTS